jgi:hypothetical protein
VVGAHRKAQAAARIPRDRSVDRSLTVHFEHLLQVNDPLNPLLDPLSRSQVWSGLVRHAERPVGLIPGLDRCVIVARGKHWIRRELHFGRVTLGDEVRFEPEQRIRYVSDAAGTHAGSSLVVTIEEPGPEVLFVRFRYTTLSRDPVLAGDPDVDAFRRSAYQAADIDTIRRVRQFALEGYPD